MSRINILDKKTANAIKAGEVIERPVSVVKELFDNAVDSGASRITVEYKNGGISMIRVTDNGIGMDREDAQKAFLIHATSKIKKIEDLLSLSTMGFRGEALPSIRALAADLGVSVITTKRAYEELEKDYDNVDDFMKEIEAKPTFKEQCDLYDYYKHS